MNKTNSHREAVLDSPRESHGFTLHPVTFGLLEWLQFTRKNPMVVGGKAELKHALELCFAFTRPSGDIVKIAPAALAKEVEKFKHLLSPEAFTAMQAHAQSELLKFQETAVVPKKPKVRAQPTARKAR